VEAGGAEQQQERVQKQEQVQLLEQELKKWKPEQQEEGQKQ
jgi:hypothetical protein